MHIWLIRHTRVGVRAGICYGQSDVPLAQSFPREFAAIRANLPKMDLPLVFSSPLSRCMQLAHALFPVPVQVDNRLKELHFGQWEGKAWDELDDGELTPWMSNYLDLAPPGGESYQEMQDRVLGFWNDLREIEREHIVIVTHGGVIRVLLAHLQALSLTRAFCLPVEYGSVHCLKRADQQAWQVSALRQPLRQAAVACSG